MEVEEPPVDVKDPQDAEEEPQVDLHKQVQMIRYFNETILAENDTLERFTNRMDHQPPLTHGLEAARAPQQEDGYHKRKWEPESDISDPLHHLTLEQKLYVSQKEVTETQQDLDKLRQTYEKINDDYEACLTEADLRLAEIRKDKKEFESRLLKLKMDKRLEMKEPEKLLQYIEDKSKVTQVEKYYMKNNGLKLLKMKLEQQLQQKIEKGKNKCEDVVQEYGEQRTEKNLEELQANHLKVQHVLTLHKDKLQCVTLESKALSNDIRSRKLMLLKIEGEREHSEEERLKAEELNQLLRRQMADYEAPGCTEYIHARNKCKKLQQCVHTWKRKVGIAQTALTTHTKAQNTQKATANPTHGAEGGARSRGRHIPGKLPKTQHIGEKNLTKKKQ